MLANLASVRGTERWANDPLELYRQKLARITPEPRGGQFVRRLKAKETVLPTNSDLDGNR